MTCVPVWRVLNSVGNPVAHLLVMNNMLIFILGTTLACPNLTTNLFEKAADFHALKGILLFPNLWEAGLVITILVRELILESF